MFGRELEPNDHLGTITSSKAQKAETGIIFDRHAPPFIPSDGRVTTHALGVMTKEKFEGSLPFEYMRQEGRLAHQRAQLEYGTDRLSRLRRLGIRV